MEGEPRPFRQPPCCPQEPVSGQRGQAGDPQGPCGSVMVSHVFPPEQTLEQPGQRERVTQSLHPKEGLGEALAYRTPLQVFGSSLGNSGLVHA
jgi:hypothetical protein